MEIITKREIRAWIRDSIAQDITNYNFDALNRLRDNENGFSKIRVARGTYGVAGGIVQGNRTGDFYAVTQRTLASSYLF